MILYHGGIQSSRIDPTPIDHLDTYFYSRNSPKVFPGGGGLFMDSGAFSIWQRGGVIDLDTYIMYLKSYQDMIDVSAALDVIGSADGSFTNYLRMRDAGLDPIPVFHDGESFDWLEKYIEMGCTYIGLGGMAKGNPASRMAFIRSVFTRFPDPTKVGFHGFGVTSTDLMTMFPWRSCDSTAAVMMGATGTICTPYGKVTVGSGLDQGRSAKQTAGRIEVVRAWVESIGRDWERAIRKDADGRGERVHINCIELTRIANTAPTTYNPP